MRWYLSRGGETVGPVEDQQVADWIRAGMRDGMIRDEAGGQWMQLRESPFQQLLPAPPPRAGRRVLVAIGMGVLGFIAGTVWSGPIVGFLVGCVAGLIGLLAGNIKLF